MQSSQNSQTAKTARTPKKWTAILLIVQKLANCQSTKIASLSNCQTVQIAKRIKTAKFAKAMPKFPNCKTIKTAKKKQL